LDGIGVGSFCSRQLGGVPTWPGGQDFGGFECDGVGLGVLPGFVGVPLGVEWDGVIVGGFDWVVAGGAIVLAVSQPTFSGRLSLRLTPRTYGHPPFFSV